MERKLVVAEEQANIKIIIVILTIILPSILVIINSCYHQLQHDHFYRSYHVDNAKEERQECGSY